MVKILEDRCVGCGQCVAFCPVEALRAWGVVEVDPQKCNDCLDCIAYCPVEALAMGG